MDVSSLAAAMVGAQAGRLQLAAAAKMMKMNAALREMTKPPAAIVGRHGEYPLSGSWMVMSSTMSRPARGELPKGR